MFADAPITGILVIGSDYRIVSADPGALGLFGCEPDEVIGKTCHEILRRSVKSCSDCDTRHVFETGESQSTVYTVRIKDGSMVTVAADLIPVYGAKGKITQVVKILRNAYPPGRMEARLRRHQEDLQAADLKFTTKVSRGWLDVGGSRMCLLDLEGGWQKLYTTLAEYAGEETAARTLFEAGAAESFTANAFRKGLIGKSASGFCDSMDCYSEAGFGDFRIDELHFSQGAAVICCRNTSESWSARYSDIRTEHPICYYSAGVLLSFMRHASGRKNLYCVEAECVACGGKECVFHVGTRAWLRKRGVEIPAMGMTMKEKVELTLEWVGRIMDGAGARQLVGKSKAMQEVLDSIETVKNSSSPVLLEGESGTGKQLVAEAIHKRGPRSEQPFVPVNCAAIPESLLESELFGHTRGAFTGATGDKPGLVDIASNGTLFIDEICEVNAAAQVKLLNVLDTGIYRRIGETKERKATMRVVAATNRDIVEEVEEKRFREDLYYRLNVIHIRIPPLRDRMEDIPLLVQHFLRHADVAGGEKKTASEEFVRVLMAHDWPGNVRELANVVERAVIVSAKENRLIPKHLPAELVEKAKGLHRRPTSLKTLREAEADHIRRVLEHEGGNKSRAARILGITRATLRRKLAQLGLA